MKARTCKTDGCKNTFVGAAQRKYCDECRAARNLAAAYQSVKDNPERAAENKRRWASANPRKTAKARTTWRINNPDRQAESYRNCRFSSMVGAARARGLEVTLSRAEYEEIACLPCFYCGGSLPPNGSGIDRINNDAGYVQGNCRPCCSVCNIAKHQMTETEFREWALLLFNHWVCPVISKQEGASSARI